MFLYKNEFVRLRFCQLPKNDIFKFLNKITKSENIKIKNIQLKAIQEYFKSDIRSMINFIQSNHNTGGLNTYIIEEDFWEDLLLKIKINQPILIIISSKNAYIIIYN